MIDWNGAAVVESVWRYIQALETFVSVTKEYPMSGKQRKALLRVEEARCGK